MKNNQIEARKLKVKLMLNPENLNLKTRQFESRENLHKKRGKIRKLNF